MTIATPDIAAFSGQGAPHVVASEEGSCLEAFSRQAPAPEWDRWIQWLRAVHWAPGCIEDDMTTAPTQETLGLALALITGLQEANPTRPPAEVVLGPNGEVIVEHRDGREAAQLTVRDDLRVDFRLYNEGRLVAKHVLVPARQTRPV